jgi:hypothetical protein
MPVKTGIQKNPNRPSHYLWTPVFTGVTGLISILRQNT